MASINLKGNLAMKMNQAKNATVHAKGLSAQRYKKLLLVCKETRLSRW